jgi:hypothetical protein
MAVVIIFHVEEVKYAFQDKLEINFVHAQYVDGCLKLMLPILEFLADKRMRYCTHVRACELC